MDLRAVSYLRCDVFFIKRLIRGILLYDLRAGKITWCVGYTPGTRGTLLVLPCWPSLEEFICQMLVDAFKIIVEDSVKYDTSKTISSSMFKVYGCRGSLISLIYFLILYNRTLWL